MRKLVCLFVAFVGISLFIACSGDDGLTKSITPYNPGGEVSVNLPSTEVFVQGAAFLLV